MSGTKEVLFFDPSELTDLQKEINVPKKPGETDNDSIDSAVSMFHLGFRKVIWYTIGLVELTKSGTQDITYEVDKKYHHLNRSYFTIELPQLRLTEKASEKYLIAWPMNIGHQIITSGRFIVDESPWQILNNYWLDIYIQFFENPGHGFRDNTQINIGNVPFLQEFSNNIPSFRLTPDQPWFYSKDSTSAFPLFRCSYMSKIKHIYNFNLDVMELIQIKDIHTGDLINIDQMEDKLTTEIFIDSRVTIPEPKLWGEYSINHKSEFECADISSTSFYIDDIVYRTSDNLQDYGSNVPIKLNSIYPTKAAFWITENMKAREKHVFSNYTTNEDNIIIGWNPVASVNFNSKKGRKFENLPSEHFDRMSSRHFRSAPFHPGYNAMPFCDQPSSLDLEPGIVFGNNDESMSFRLKNTNPIKNPSESVNSKFKVHLIELVTRKVILNNIKTPKEISEL